MANLFNRLASPTYPQNGTFGQLLEWHLKWGTRPQCSTTDRSKNRAWIETEFGLLVCGTDNLLPKSALRNVANWKNGKLPDAKRDADRIDGIVRELFDGDTNLLVWKSDLLDALVHGRKAQAAKIARLPVPEPLCVPRSTLHFMGRDDDVEALTTALASGEHSAILIQGGPGIGKTELIKAIAYHAQVVAHFGKRRWFVSLKTADNLEKMKAAIISAIGGDPKLGFEAVLDSLTDQPTLLIFDNLENMLEPTGERASVEDLLNNLIAISGVTLLASIRGQRVMMRSQWLTHHLTELSREDAAALFASVAGNWVYDDTVFDDLLTVLGGLPLALELIAFRAHGCTDLQPLLHQWQNFGHSAATFPEGNFSKFASLHDFIEAEILLVKVSDNSESAMRLFALLGALPDGITISDLEKIMGVSSYGAIEILRNSGLVFEQAARLRMPTVFQSFAQNNHPILVGDGRNCNNLFIDKARIAMFANTRGQNVDYSGNDTKNIVLAFLRGHCSLRPDDAPECIYGLYLLTMFDGNVVPYKVMKDIEKICAAEEFALGYAASLEMLGCCAEFEDSRTASYYFHKAQDIYKICNYRRGIVSCLKRIAVMHYRNRRPIEGERNFVLALHICSPLNDIILEADIWLARGDMFLPYDDEPSLAKLYFDKSYDLYKKAALDVGCAAALLRIGEIYFAKEEYDIADHYWRRLAEITDRSGSQLMTVSPSKLDIVQKFLQTAYGLKSH